MPDLSALAALRDEVAGCTRCALADGRTQTVFGVGDPEAELMLVGEGPGREEDLRGEPFVGRSGRLLDTLLTQELGFDRSRCYIANTVKCLSGDAPVQLADGSWAPIERLVRSRYSGRVRSVDPSGQVVPARVVGWHASPLAGRRVYRLTYRQAAGPRRDATAEVRLTADHEVLAEQGWTPAGRLRPGARIATGHALSPLVRDLVTGTVLGDPAGGVRRVTLALGGMPGAEAAVRGELGAAVLPGRALAAGGGGAGPAGGVDVDVARSPALGILTAGFVVAGAPRVPRWVGRALSPRVAAAWFLGAGQLRARPGRPPALEIGVRGASEDDLAVVRRGLDALGVAAHAARGGVCLDPVATRRFATLVAPYVPAPLRGLLPRDVARTAPYDAMLLSDTDPEVLYDDALVDEIEPADPDEPYYCLDVEGTHSFVSAGGVVHNCRPPANRDPTAAELAACRGYLDRQLELVDPRVVVTLGNVATRALLDTTKGIRSIRGTPYPFGRAWLVPTYHPAAALRSGGEVVAEMRADLVRAKRLLASGTRPPR